MSSTTSVGSLLPTGYLSTDGNQIVDAGGTDVRIASVGWFDVGAGPLQGIQANVDAMAAAGFNTIRVPWYDATLQADLPQFQQIVAAATQAGMTVIFDHHGDEAPSASNGYGSQQANGLPFDLGPGTDGTDGMGDTGTVTEQDFVNDTQTLAQAFAGNSTVIGFDLDNEPLAYGGESTWGTGGPTDLQQIYEQAGDAIQAVDPGALIIAEGPQNYDTNFAGTAPAPYGDLSLVGQDPVTLTIPNKVVYSVHDYPAIQSGYSGPDSGAQAIANMNADFGYLETDNIAPVWIGEMGASMDGTDGTQSQDQAWASTLVDYMNGDDGAEGGPTFTGSQQGMDSDWWAWGNLSGEFPDGTENSDGSLNASQQAVYSQLQYYPTSASASDPTPTPTATASATASPSNATVLAGSAAAITDASGNTWTITSSAQVAFNGTAIGGTANVVELAYVNGVVWQENTGNDWYSIVDNGGTFSAGAGPTTTSPLPAAATPTPTATVAATTSPNDTTVLAGSAAAITDASGNSWTIASGAQVAFNGTAIDGTANVIELAYVNGTVWQENTSDNWYSIIDNAGTFSAGAGPTTTSPLPAAAAPTPAPVATPTPTPIATPAASPNDTTVVAGATAGITDASGNDWTITSGAQVADNGAALSGTANVTELAYVNGTVWQENASGNWYSIIDNGGTFSAGAGPTTISPLPAATTSTVTIPQGQASTTVSQNQVSVGATSGNNMVFISGTGDEVNLTGGNNTITDTGSGNTYVVPAAGQGTDTFTSDILNTGDTLDLSTALAATNWNGTASTLPNYLTVASSAQGAVLSIAPTSGGAGAAIATIAGATNATLSTVLAHAVT